MGYDLHITRRPEWSDEGGPEITLEEWMAYVNSREELRTDADNGPTDFLWTAHPKEPWPLWWDRGEIYTKNPDEFTLRKLAAIAEQLNATMQGDDGEVYRADGAAPEPESATSPSAARPTFLSRIGSWFRRRRDALDSQQDAPAFCIGQRVKDPWGAVGTVLEVDRNANGGLGNVRVRFDDGREHDSTCVASGLEIVGDESGGG
jgi:hypothetical protein